MTTTDKAKAPMRRAADRIRQAADAAWARGSRSVAESLHSDARRATSERRIENRKETR